MALQHGTPRHQRELSSLFDDGEAAAGEIDMLAIDTFDLLPRLSLDTTPAPDRPTVTGDARKLTTTQDVDSTVGAQTGSLQLRLRHCLKVTREI